MPSKDSESLCKTWFSRIDKAKKAKKRWEDDYQIAKCKEYWRGNQLEDPQDEFDQTRVQINKIHPSVRASIPSIYFHDPFVRVYASPALADTPGQKPLRSIDEKATLLQDTGNTFVRDPKTNFDNATHLCLKEAQWSFGCVRVMHDAVPVENPAVKPSLPLKEGEETPVPPSDPEAMDLPGTVIGSERFYVKRIPARQVLVAPDHVATIEEIPWVGYWSISYLEDVKNTKSYANVKDLKSTGVKTNEDQDHSESDTGSPGGSEKVKLYHIWDQRSMRHYVFAEDHLKGPLLDKKYKRLPLKFLRFDLDPDSFFPLPPIYHTLHPQDEFNDSREWLRKNRKGTVPRYTYDKEAIDPKDMRKLESGEMGTYIPRESNTHGVIEAVQQPNYSVVATQTLALSKEEFAELSMVASERKGVPLSTTATQAKIVDTRSQVIESFDRVTMAKFLASIVEEMLLMAVDEMSLSHWVLMNADQNAAGFQLEAQVIESMWQEITHSDLEDAVTGIDWRVVVEEGSMSPVSEEQEREKWMRTMAFMENPVAVRLMHFSPELRKKTLAYNGIKSARDQDLIAKAFEMMVMFEQQMAMMGGPAAKGVPSEPSNAPQGVTAPGPEGPPEQGAEGAPAPKAIGTRAIPMPRD